MQASSHQLLRTFCSIHNQIKMYMLSDVLMKKRLCWVVVNNVGCRLRLPYFRVLVSGSDSEDSEFSSLEREKKHESIYQRVSRRPTPYRKKAKQKTPHEAYPKQKSAHSDKHRPPRVSASADRGELSL